MWANKYIFQFGSECLLSDNGVLFTDNGFYLPSSQTMSLGKFRDWIVLNVDNFKQNYLKIRTMAYCWVYNFG